MGKCALHLDRETNFICMKHEVYMCDDCLRCRDPEIYCKFRPSCPIWFLVKQKKREEAKLKKAAELANQVTVQPYSKSIDIP